MLTVEPMLAVVVGILVAGGAYLMMSNNLIRFLFGLTVISNAANLAIFTAGRMTYGAPPLVADGQYVPPDHVANSLPQALILTAIVISFGLLAFTLALIVRSFGTFGTTESSRMREAEPAADRMSAGE